MFGPEYPKIQSVFKRTVAGVILPGDWTLPEFEYLRHAPWRWTEKIDGTNIRLHWDGTGLFLGGRTDKADVSARLASNIAFLQDPALWKSVFPDADDVTVYGEGYGAGIQSGGNYRPDQAFIIFDVRIGRWWLKDVDIALVATELGLSVVPFVAETTLLDAWVRIQRGEFTSQWPGVMMEGVVGRPTVDLFDRRGDRIITKMKLKDWTNYEKAVASGLV
jgi:hypothetical protein